MARRPLPATEEASSFCGGRWIPALLISVDVHDPQGPPGRSEPREIIELRRLKDDQPELAAAANLQIELIQLQRRVQSALRLPSIKLEPEYLNNLLGNGPILQFDHLVVDWNDVRFLLRATAAAMRTHEALEEDDYRRAEALARDADKLPAAIRVWYDSVRPGATGLDAEAGLETVISQTMRPFWSAPPKRSWPGATLLIGRVGTARCAAESRTWR